jgi:hypothetical protein
MVGVVNRNASVTMPMIKNVFFLMTSTPFFRVNIKNEKVLQRC